MSDTKTAIPKGVLTTRTSAMPADTNAAGDIFGGWVMSQMDMAGAIAAREVAGGRVATVAVEAMKFIAPVKVGDIFSVYTTVEKVGNSSISICLEAYTKNIKRPTLVKVTDAKFIFVALDEFGRKRMIVNPVA